MTPAPLRFLWFGSYSKGPGYPRNETLMAGLRARGHVVEEAHAPLFEGAGERVALGGGGGVVKTAARQSRAALRLAGAWFRASPHNVAVVGSGGVVDVPLLRFLQNIDRRPVVLDAFVPLYDTVVRDRGLAAPGSARARVLRRAERLSGRLADLVLADTGENAQLVAEDLSVPLDDVAVVPIAQPDPGPPAALPDGGPLRVILVATYIPLHGVETVVRAARSLGGAGLEITIVGTGQLLPDVKPLAEGVAGLQLVEAFEPPERIAERLAQSHVGLGVFGTTEKAARVVPFKAVLTLAAGRALVTRDSPAAQEALDGAALLVEAGDPHGLAAALARLRDDRAETARLADAGRRRYVERFTPESAARSLEEALAARGLLP